MSETKHWRTKNRVGEIYTTNEGYEIEITEYFSNKDSTIKFKNSGLIVKNISFGNITAGTIRNPYHPAVFGVGYAGIGPYRISIGRKLTKTYVVWNDMLRRCYSDKSLKRQPTYIGCSVYEKWHNFQNFAKWFEENYREGYYLDKDILIKGNKIYGPNTCDFVPVEVNNLLIKSNKIRGYYPIGVSKNGNKFQAALGSIYLGLFDSPELAFAAYKFAKEEYIKEVANKWRGRIPERTYKALINYVVEITD